MHQLKVTKERSLEIPGDVLQQLDIEAGDVVVVRIEDGSIIVRPEKRDPIEELRGLGKEIWAGIDVDAYVDELRDEW